MKVIFQPASTAARCGRRSGRRPLAVAIGCLLTVIMFAEDVNAQFFRGYRPRGAVVIAPPFFPGPYVGAPFGAPPIFAPPVIAAPPSAVRIRTPFFSMNIDPNGYIPPRSSVYGYQYETFGPSQDLGYAFPGTGPTNYGAARPSWYADQNAYADQYSPGSGGGIPELSPPDEAFPTVPSPAPISLATLSFSAETLRRALASRGDGDVWLDYLQLETIIMAAESGWPTPELSNLRTRFDGVTMNRELSAITRLPGFPQTQRLLAAWLDSEGIQPVSPNEDLSTDSTGRTPDQNVPRIAPKIPAERVPDQADDRANEELPVPAPVPAPVPSGLDPFSSN